MEHFKLTFQIKGTPPTAMGKCKESNNSKWCHHDHMTSLFMGWNRANMNTGAPTSKKLSVFFSELIDFLCSAFLVFFPYRCPTLH